MCGLLTVGLCVIVCTLVPGVLLSSVITFNEEGQRYQFLIILDAKTMTEVARAELPEVSVPKTFHGSFLTDWF